MASEEIPQVYLVREKDTSMYFLGMSDSLANRVKELEFQQKKKLKVTFEYRFWEPGNQKEASKAARNEIKDYPQRTFQCADSAEYFNIPNGKFDEMLINIYKICARYDVNDADVIAEKNKTIKEQENVIKELEKRIAELEKRIAELEKTLKKSKK